MVNYRIIFKINVGLKLLFPIPSSIRLKVTIDGETRDLKLTPRQSGALKAICYLEKIDPFQRILESVVTDLRDYPVQSVDVDQ